MHGAHQLDGLGAEQALAVQLAAIEQHLGELEVILGIGHQPSGAGEVSRIRNAGLLIYFGECPTIPVIRRGDARQTLLWWMEENVFHPERLENLLTQELVEALAGGDFDDAAERLKPGAGAIAPAGCRLEVQRGRA